MNAEELIHNYGTYIYNYALKLSCHPNTAEDLCQETFIKAWKKIDTLKNPDAIKSWLRRICFNNFLMNERKKNNHIELLYDEIINLEQEGNLYINTYTKPEDEIIVKESISELQNGCFLAMARLLTLNQRIAFSLVDMFGLSLEEVSEILNISKSATKGLLYRAHMNLDSFFDNHCNILDVKNPCSCEAWIEFANKKENLQIEAKQKNNKLIKTINYKESNYTFNNNVRNKINYLYKNMPDKKPSDEWYEGIIKVLNN